jgi:hypothetical protein
MVTEAGKLFGPVAGFADLDHARRSSPRWVYALVIFEFVCQALLLFEAIAPIRLVVRVGAFSGSLALLLLLRGPKVKLGPFATLILVALSILALELLHPLTNSIAAGIATFVFNLCIVAPIFWACRLRVDAQVLRTLFRLYWALNLASAVMGALQVYFPGSFQPAVSSVLAHTYMAGFHITLANGARVLRPMGLTDTPGGAGIGAMYCALLALGHLLDRPRPLFRAVLLLSIGVSLFTLYLCQVRSLLAMFVIGVLTLGAVLAMQRDAARLTTVSLSLAALAVGAFVLSVDVGGDAVTDRLSTLTEGNVMHVYHLNRGIFLENTLTQLLPEFPVGAGLGRWGMMNAYFGDPLNWESPPIYAELQWTGWILDGGAPLALAYSAAVVSTIITALRIALRRIDGKLGPAAPFAVVLVAYDVGALALTFNSAPFAGTLGLDFWILNATLFVGALAAAPTGAAHRVARSLVPAGLGPLLSSGR